MTEQAQQTAKALVQLIPPSVAPDFLEEYGLTLTTQQAQAITKELLALTLYWMTCAVRVSIPEPVCSQMHHGAAIREHDGTQAPDVGAHHPRRRENPLPS